MLRKAEKLNRNAGSTLSFSSFLNMFGNGQKTHTKVQHFLV